MSKKYENIRVSGVQAKKARDQIRKAVPQAKLGTFFASRHYNQLRREQLQRLHVNHPRSFDGNVEHVCSCGLICTPADLEGKKYFPNEELKLGPLLLVEGHRNLPSCKGVTVALTVSLQWDGELNDYLWLSYCQVCGEVSKFKPEAENNAFLESHNQSCKK